MERDPSPAESDKKKTNKLRAPIEGALARDRRDAAEPATEKPPEDRAARDIATFLERLSDAKPPIGDREAPRKEDKQPAPEAPPSDRVAEQPEAAAGDQSPEVEAVAKLEPAERREAGSQLLEARAAVVGDERAQSVPGSLEARAADGAAAFLAAAERELGRQDVTPEQAADAAYQQVTGEAAPALPDDLAAEAPADEEPAAVAQLPVEALSADQTLPPEVDDGTGAPFAPGGGWRGGATAGAAAGWAGGFVGGRRAGPGAIAAPGLRAAERASAVGSGLLVGGIVGYLLGRRRGRIRTERELLPIQHRLEQQVQHLSNTLAVREAQVRQAVYERAAAPNILVAPAAPREAAPAPAERPTPAAPEATPSAGTERPMPGKQETLAPLPRSTERMPLDEVLRLSETILIGPTTLRQIFETHQISERGLRRVADEHLRGGDTRKALEDELWIKEIGHELDPQLRDRPPEEMHAAQAASTSAVSAIPDGMQQPDPNAASFASVPPIQAHSDMNDKHASSPLIVANIVALAVLAGLLIFLLVLWLLR